MNRQCYGASKGELMGWLKQSMKVSVHKLEELGNGYWFCVILDRIHPGRMPMHKLNKNARLQHENLANLKILSTVMGQLNILNNFDHFKIANHNFQHILRLLQWFKGYAQDIGNEFGLLRKEAVSLCKEKREVMKDKANKTMENNGNERHKQKICLQKRDFEVQLEVQRIVGKLEKIQGIVKEGMSCQKKIEQIKRVMKEKNQNRGTKYPEKMEFQTHQQERAVKIENRSSIMSPEKQEGKVQFPGNDSSKHKPIGRPSQSTSEIFFSIESQNKRNWK